MDVACLDEEGSGRATKPGTKDRTCAIRPPRCSQAQDQPCLARAALGSSPVYVLFRQAKEVLTKKRSRGFTIGWIAVSIRCSCAGVAGVILEADEPGNPYPKLPSQPTWQLRDGITYSRSPLKSHTSSTLSQVLSLYSRVP